MILVSFCFVVFFDCDGRVFDCIIHKNMKLTQTNSDAIQDFNMEDMEANQGISSFMR
jgi:hypothetical protein